MPWTLLAGWSVTRYKRQAAAVPAVRGRVWSPDLQGACRIRHGHPRGLREVQGRRELCVLRGLWLMGVRPPVPHPRDDKLADRSGARPLSLIHISEPTRLGMI